MATRTAKAATPKSRAAKTSEELSEELGRVLSTDDAETAVGKKVREERAARVLKVVSALDVKALAGELTQTSFYVKELLDGVATQVGGYVQQLEDVREAVDVTKAELAELYDKEVLAQSLLHLKNRVEVATQESIKAIAEAEESAARKVKALQQEAKDIEAQLIRKRLEEQNDYAYQTMQRRRQEDDDILQTRLQQDRAYKEREAALAAKEAEYVAAQERIAGLPEEIKKEVARAEAILRATLTKDAEHKAEVATLQAKAEKDMLSTQNRNLLDQLALTKTQLEAVTARLAVAESRVESIAKEALQSASGRQALEAANSMAATLKDSPKK